MSNRSLIAFTVACFLAGGATAVADGYVNITPYKYSNITTDATTVVKAGPGTLHTVCINTAVATETIQLYDNTAASGTKISLITEVSTTQGCFVYDIAFINGLTVVTAVAAGDITVLYQ